MTIDPKIFGSYDIRGIYPENIKEEIFYKIAQAYAKLAEPKTVAVGRDVRISGEKLMDAVIKGLTEHGVNVIDVGIITTDMAYFAAAAYDFDGAISVTASHNPREYNGLKLVRRGGIPISESTGILEMRDLVLKGYEYKSETPGTVLSKNIFEDYKAKCLRFIDVGKIKKLKVVANAMFGKAVENIKGFGLPIEIIPLNETPDGTFPKGAPDPFLPENRKETEEKIREAKADMGVAWDGDADRVFLWDENGRFIPGYFFTAFLAKYFCEMIPGARIISDPRLTWAIEDTVKEAGGTLIINKVGHSFIKERMREEAAVFAGESSGHFYFRDYFYCDNGLIPFLLILQILSESGQRLSEIFQPYFDKYFISDEINLKLDSKEKIAPTLKLLDEKYSDAIKSRLDGITLRYKDWQTNIRASNTQPLLRINLEAKSPKLLEEKKNEILSVFG